MREIKVKEVMDTDPLVVHLKDPVKKIAELFVKKNIDGAPVVDDQGNLAGIVTDTDLVMQDVRFRFPSFLHFLDGYIFLGGLKDFESEFKKAVGATVEEVMTKDVIKLTEGQTVEDAATLMVDNDVDRVPVVSGSKLVGLVSKGDIVKLISRS